MDYEQEIEKLKDTVAIVAGLERLTAAAVSEHAKMLSAHARYIAQDQEYRQRRELDMAEIRAAQSRHERQIAEARRRHEQEIAEARSRHEQDMAEIRELQKRTELNLAEITGKLNGLIGYMDGLRPPPA